MQLQQVAGMLMCCWADARVIAVTGRQKGWPVKVEHAPET